MCVTRTDQRVDLPDDLSAARAFRDVLRRGICPQHGAASLDTALLLATELAVNAVRHGSPPVHATVTCCDDVLRLSVRDSDPRLPEPREAAPEDVSGRGMALVAALSERWGVERHDGDGKTVWLELRTAA
ncbi:ATP-binding protein [Kineococcus sp. SYSU DK004]|uniref:ATP-binding protein n=1 Tax=Kineococcus sp. SYSU DK004 TaxID=3383125 RepID=UPI003D7C3895